MRRRIIAGTIPLTALLAAALGLATFGGAQAAAPAPSTASVDPAARAQALNSVLLDAMQHGRSRAETRARLAAAGFDEVTTTRETMELTSGASAVNVPGPTFTTDRTTGRLWVTASYNWVNSTWSGDVRCSSSAGCNEGGKDAFALGYSQTLVQRGTYPRFSGSDNATPVSKPAPVENNGNGVGYEFQDKMYVYYRDTDGTGVKIIKDYLGKYGTISVEANQPACGVTVQAWGKYAHTWSTAAVTSVDIAVSVPAGVSIGISISNVDHSFTKATRVGSTYKRC